MKIKFPKAIPKRLLSVEIETPLFNRVKKESKTLNVSLRQIVEYGFQNFLAERKKQKEKK